MPIGLGIGVGAGGSGGASTAPETANVSGTAQGPVYSLKRRLGSGSALSAAAGTHSNLQVVNGSISALAALGVGNSQKAVIRESVAATDQAVEYRVMLTGDVAKPAVPVVSLSPGNGKATIAWVDGNNGGAPITAHQLYRGTSAGQEVLIGTITSASPYVDTGLTNDTTYFYRVSAVNSKGEGPLSASASVKPGAIPTGDIDSREPYFADDSTKGFAVGDLWYNKVSRTLYRATAVAAGAAAWSALATPPMPADAVPGALVAVGTMKIKAAYAGPLIRAVGGNGATYDVPLSGDDADVAGLNTFLTTAGDGSFGTWYDQSGSGRDLAVGNAPKATRARLSYNNGLAVEGDKNAQAAGPDYSLPSSVAIPLNSYTVVAITGWWLGFRGALFDSGGTGFTDRMWIASAGDYGLDGNASNPNQAVIAPTINRQVGIFSANGTTLEHRLNSRVATGSPTGSSFVATAAKFGRLNNLSNYGNVGKTTGLLVYAKTFSASEKQAMYESCVYWGRVVPQWDTLLVDAGDSITQGLNSGTNAAGDLRSLTSGYLDGRPTSARPIVAANCGVSGLRMIGQLDARAAVIDALYKPGRNCVLHIWIGTNDGLAGTAAATVYAALKAFVAARIAVGWKVIVGTTLPRGDYDDSTFRPAYNNMIKSGELAGMGGVILDYASIAGMADPTSSNYFDLIHPSAAGAALVDAYRRPVIDQALA